jgi:hypothetical protein
MPANERVAIRSLLDKDVPKSIKDDLVALALAIPLGLKEYTGNPVMPGESGTYQVYLVSRLATSASDATNRHGLTITRNGAVASSARYSTVGLPDTDDAEIVAFQAYFLGELVLFKNDIVEAVPTIYGNPSPMLTRSDLILRLQEVPRRGYR